MDETSLRNVNGTIFNIQHYSIHDGPGIRTNVFVKGCPLHCLWCSNPESQSPHPQLMFRADLCTSCTACISSCPSGAISLNGQIIQNDRSVCKGCGTCTAACPNKAREIVGMQTTAGDVFDDVSQDVLFYAEDGGVTLTGGEVLSQPEFSSAVLQLCKNAGIHTAIETCGFASWDVLSEILKSTDLVLFDIKEMNPELHQKYTGVDNIKILENLKRINDLTDCEIWVRVPLIPGFNDDKENLRATACFVKDNLKHCTQIHLLPFHRLGEGKYVQLEKAPNGFSSDVPSDAYMDSLREYVGNYFICF